MSFFFTRCAFFTRPDPRVFALRPAAAQGPLQLPSAGQLRQLWDWLRHLPRLLSVLGATQQSEDCLFLNVHVPPEDEDQDEHGVNTTTAVLVWLHGGGFLIGDGSAEEYGPELLLDHRVIVVSLNYRLGVLGAARGNTPCSKGIFPRGVSTRLGPSGDDAEPTWKNS